MKRHFLPLILISVLFLSADSFAQNGIIQMDYTEYFTPNGRQDRVVYVWNTKTGKSARYYYQNESWKKSTVALPDNPLGDNPSEAGEIMMDYTEYFTPNGRQDRVVYVWNTKTGKSARYYYQNESWKKSTVALPSSPLD